MSRQAERDLEWTCELKERRHLKANISLGGCGYIFAYVYTEMEKIISKLCHESSMEQSSGVLINSTNTRNFKVAFVGWCSLEWHTTQGQNLKPPEYFKGFIRN